MSLPKDIKNNHCGYDTPYFKGLVSERMVIKRIRGKERIEWEPRSKGIRNEPLDVRVYATGALEIYNPDLEKRRERRTVKTKKRKVTDSKTPVPEQPVEAPKKVEEKTEQKTAPRQEKQQMMRKRGFRVIGRGMRV